VRDQPVAPSFIYPGLSGAFEVLGARGVQDFILLGVDVPGVHDVALAA